MSQPHIVALGGTLRPRSTTSTALERALAHAQAAGARTTLLNGTDIDFPNYDPETALENEAIRRFVDTIRSADAIVIGSPGYHGTLSGLVKNALDHVELLSRDERVYFDGMPVGLIATAGGWQAAVSTLQALRTIVHALRGWPTPMGVAINSAGNSAGNGAGTGDCVAEADPALAIMMQQMMAFLAGAGRSFSAR